jgi:DNA-binding MarR family transcriptional regulator
MGLESAAIGPERLASELRPVLTSITVSWRREMASATGVGVSQAQILLHLVRDGSQRVSQIAASQGVSGASATGLISRMEESGWVRRRPDPTDGRAVLVEVTEPGRRVLDEVAAARTRLLAMRLGALSREQLAQIAAALPALRQLERDWAERRGTGHR